MAGTTDTVPARLTPGEFVIKRESAEMLGLPLLEQLNAVSDGAAHDNIDAIIAQATLSQMQPMVGGGSVGNENIAGYENGGKVPGYENGGSVSDATATSAMDELLAQAMLEESAKGQSQYSMVDADRIGAEENEMMNMIMSMAIPGAGVAGTAKAVTGKIPKLASEIIKMIPAKGKQKVLDKIAGTMKVAPTKMQLNKKAFDKMDLINPGYMQRYTNKLVKARDKLHLKQIGGKDVRVGDVVDAVYPRGFLNVDELKRISNIIPKQYRESEIAKLLKMSKGGSQNIGGYKTGGKVPKGSHASGKWGEFGEYNKALGQPDSAGVAEQAGIIQALLDELIAEEAYKDSVQNEMDKNYLLDSLINKAPSINEMLKTLPDSPGLIESPQRPTKNQFLKELLKQGVII